MKSSAAVPLAPAGAITQTAARDRRATARASSPNLKVLARLRAVDESIISELVRRYHRPLLRFALRFLRSEALAEEVVQDTWTAVVDGLASFEGRSSVELWIFRILANRAKTRLRREARSVPFSALEPCDSDDAALDPTRFSSQLFIEAHEPTANDLPLFAYLGTLRLDRKDLDALLRVAKVMVKGDPRSR